MTHLFETKGPIWLTVDRMEDRESGESFARIGLHADPLYPRWLDLDQGQIAQLIDALTRARDAAQPQPWQDIRVVGRDRL